MPAAEVDLTVELVRALVAEQFPDLLEEGAEIVPVANGWDNGVFRLGPTVLSPPGGALAPPGGDKSVSWAVRLPRRAMAAPLVEHEQRWLPELAERLPLPIPVPVRRGKPSTAIDYPWRWSVCPWFDGVRVAVAEPPLTASERAAVAGDLRRFLAALAVPAPEGVPFNPYRGVPLADRDEVFRERVARLSGDPSFNGASALAVWDRALAAPVWDGPPIWLHGDLHPANVLVGADRRLSAVLDFGDLTAGDPATDLAAAWMFLPTAPERQALQATTDDATWTRARGWALNHAVACLAGSADEPVIAAMAARTLAAVLDPDQPV